MTLILPTPNGRPKPPATVLQGPADADAFRVKVGRYKERFYCDPLPACDIAPATDETWPSVSRIKSAKPFEGANYVAMKRIAQEFANGGLPSPQGFAAQSFDQWYDRFKSIDRLGLQAAGKRGTHVHKMAEQMLYGLPVDADGPGAEYRGALEDFFAAYQPELVAAEVVCIVRGKDDGYGGTADAIVRIDGKTYLIDWKSRSADSDHAAYPEEGAQLAAYSAADYIIVQGEDGTAKRAEFPNIDGILILSVKPDGVKVYPVGMVAAHRYFCALHNWYLARQTEDAHIGKPWPIKRAPVRTDVAPGVVATSKPKPTMPDEGGTVRDVDVKALRDAFMSQPPEHLSAIVAVTKEAAAEGLPCSVTQFPSVRRFEIARGLMAWARYTNADDGGHDLLRTLVRIVTGDEAAEMPSVPVGQVVGAMDWRQATQFADAICLLRDGGALGFDPAGSPVVMPPMAA